MNLTKYQRYAIQLLRELRQGGGPLKRRVLAEKLGISDLMVQQVMIPLLKARLVASSRSNTRGGYQLANPRHRVTVGEVVAALPRRGEEPDSLDRKVEAAVARALNQLRVDDL